MKQSRKYQQAIENEIPYALRDYGHVIIQAPTGAGKSHIINKTVQRIMAVGKTPLVLSDSLKIHEQLVKECNGWPIISSIKMLHILPGQCYVAMTQTINRREPIVEQFAELGEQTVVIVDECHRNTMTPVVEAIKPKWLLGFSATPHYRWAKHLPRLYKHLIHGPQIKELQADGFLVHYQHLLRTGADLSKLETKNGEFTERSQDVAFGGRRMYDGLFEDLPRFKKRKTVIYVASIELCEQVYRECLVNGYNATRYHSALVNGAEELKKFTEGDCDVCVSVSSLTLGWDFPMIDLVVLWRATTSLPLYLQICGRGSRPWENALEKKNSFTVLDYGANFNRFGAWNMDRDWSELWKPEKRKISTYAGVAGSKECPVCHYLMNVSTRVCPNCGYMYTQEEMKLVQGMLVEVENSLKNIEQRNVSTFSPHELADYAKLKDKKTHAIRIAKRMEQETPGFLSQFALEMNYKKAWVERMKQDINSYKGQKISFYDSIVR